MTKDKEKKLGKGRQLLEAARLGQMEQLETILYQLQPSKSKKRSNPLASLRKVTGPGDVRDPVTGFTCLHHAALNGQSACVKLILEQGACKLNSVDYKGSSALHLASWAGNLQVVKILLEYSSSSLSNAANHNSSQAIIGTTSVGHHHYLHHDQKQPQQQQQQQQQDASGDQRRFDEIDIDLRNNDRQTALSLAAQFGHSQVVRELLAHGASCSLRNNQLESPLDLACANGRLETVRILLDQNACEGDDSSQLVATSLLGRLRSQHALLQAEELEPACRLITANTNRPSSSLVANQAAPYKRQWSTLLRGSSSASSSTTSKTTTSHSPQSSPSQSSSAATNQQKANHHHQSDEAWPTTSKRRASLTNNTLQAGRNAARPQLLDHSPLHLAVRRNHLQIVALLLGNKYQANIFQLTSMGSLMHELAISASRMTTSDEQQKLPAPTLRSASSSSLLYKNCSDMIQLFWSHILSTSANQLEEARLRWREFLALKNPRQMDVFQVLNELNTCHAHEIKRIILHFSSAELHHPPAQSGYNLPLAKSQLIASSNNITSASQQAVFNSSQQFNSFVTMKRVPKNQQNSNNKENLVQASTNNYPQLMGDMTSITMMNNINNPAPATSFIKANETEPRTQSNQTEPRTQSNQTQTIDRRAMLAYRRNQQSAQSMQVDSQPWQTQASMDHQQAPLTRSVSNIMQQQALQSYDHHQQQQQQQQQQQEQQMQKLLSNFQWQSVAVQPQATTQHAVMATAQARKRRSRSRDLGSLLQEAQQQQQQQHQQLQHRPLQEQQQEHLYDNNNNNTYGPGMINAAAAAVAIQPLVRSQTDCSHLMSRFHEDGDLARQPLDDAGQVSGGESHHTVQQRNLAISERQRQWQQQQHQATSERINRPSIVKHNNMQQFHQSNTLDRKTINRHYHVYEHEFYPPRLINQFQATNQSHGSVASEIGSCSTAMAASKQASGGLLGLTKQTMVAIVPPMQMQSAQSGLLGQRSPSQQQQQQQQRLASLRQDSRLSLNLEPNFNGRQPIDFNHPQMSRQNSGGSMRANIAQETIKDFRQPHTIQAIHSSQSLESRLAEHSFEHSRQVIMRDIDQMIGRELLSNANSSFNVHNDLPRSSTMNSNSILLHDSSSSQSSILTGVSLDMDTLGERITVSGTRITLPSPMQAPKQQQQPQHTDQTPASYNIGAPPEKPPRHSVQGPKIYRPQRQASTSEPMERPRSGTSSRGNIIYDLPSTGSLIDNHNHHKQNRQQSTNTSPSVISQTLASATPNGGASPRAPQSAITEPPSGRPPPPPPMTTPLKVVAPNGADKLSLTSSCSLSSCSTSSSTANELRAMAARNALLAASSNTSNNNNNNNRELLLQPAISMSQTAQQVVPSQTQASASARFNAEQNVSVDGGDSGVCTSNSPASMSHDSHEGPMMVMSFINSVERQTLAQQQALTIDTSIEERRNVLNQCERSSSASSCAHMSPPSPRTAQSCIEQALLPLESTAKEHFATSEQDKFTQSASDENNEIPFSSIISNWLANSTSDGTLKSLSNPLTIATKQESDYENCIMLQEQLMRSCRSDSFSVLTRADLVEKDTETDDDDDDDDDEDYAATTAADDDEHRQHQSSDGESEGDGMVLPPIINESKRKQRKEILLKVVFDESEPTSSGQEVFYINPIDLKKISRPEGNKRREAETLTDEELFACVDKESGLIKFTLRKRRCDSNPNDTSQQKLQCPTTMSGMNDCQTIREEENHIASTSLDDCGNTRQQAVGCSEQESLSRQDAKRTKLVDYGEKIERQQSVAIKDLVDKWPMEPRNKPQLLAEKSLSTESNESVLMMDASSQASSTSTSSSAMDSIRSIVSLKQMTTLTEQNPQSQSTFVPEAETVPGDVGNCRGSEAKDERQPQEEVKATDEEEEDKEEEDHEEKVKGFSENSTTIKSSPKDTDSHKQIESLERKVKKEHRASEQNPHSEPTGGSIVSETARRLEEAAAAVASALPTYNSRQIQDNCRPSKASDKLFDASLPVQNQANEVRFQPVAAIRATKNQTQKTTTGPLLQSQVLARENMDQEALIESNKSQSIIAKKLTSPLSATNKTMSIKEKNCEDEENEPEVVVVEKVLSHHTLGKRSICWPPRQLIQDNPKESINKEHKIEASEETENNAENCHEQTSNEKNCIKLSPSVAHTIGRVTANRLSFQKMIEEKNKTVGTNFALLKSSFENKQLLNNNDGNTKSNTTTNNNHNKQQLFPTIGTNNNGQQYLNKSQTPMAKPQPPAKPKSLVAAQVSKFNK